MKRTRITIVLDIEVIEPGVELFHVEHFGPYQDLWIYRDDAGRLRSVTPRHDLPTPLSDAWLDDLPPLAAIIATAFPETKIAA